LRIARRIAVFLLIVAPVGFLVGVTEAGAVSDTPTLTYTNTGSTAVNQNYGAETLGTTFGTFTTVANSGLAGVYPDANAPGVTLQTNPDAYVLCTAPTASTLTTPSSANYQCTPANTGTLIPPGTYTVRADFPGGASTNGTNDGVTQNQAYDSSTDDTLTINAAPNTLGSTLTNAADTVTYPNSSTNIPAGSALTDTAAISNLQGPTTGVVDFTVETGGTCTGTALENGAPTAASSTPFNFNAPNATATVFSVNVHYGGSTDDAGAPDVCEGPFTTTLATTSISTVATTTASIGSPISDTVTLSGLSGTNATGSVTITAQVGSCSGAGVFSTVLLLNSSEISGTTATVSGQFTPTSPPASYFWSVSYSGDTNNSPFTEACGGTDEESTVGTANSSTLTQVIVDSTGNPPTGNEVAGTSYHDTATVSGAITPTGTVTYDFYDNSSCSGSYATTQQVTIAGGLVPNSATTGPLGAGSYSYCVSYSGDVNNAPSSAGPEQFSVYPASTTLSITTSRLPSGNHGRAYSAAIATSGGTAPLHFSLSAVGSGQRVPPGLSINPTTGVISGVAGATGTYIFTVTVTDSTLPTHQTVSKTLSITIS
jgi:hypothetical protein